MLVLYAISYVISTTQNLIFARRGLTVCVTCAWAGTAKPSSQEKAKACENAWDVRRLPSVRCTLYWLAFEQDSLIENQNHRHKTDEIIARTLIFSKNQKLQAKIFIRKT
jgi:hypothetical protein